jgi:cytochrome c-type biogenesis protein CcmH/NrfG
MDITFNSQNADAALALKALQHYRAKDYKPAQNCLLELLDVDPKNWHARLLLAVCYYKTSQLATAARAFQFIYDGCNDDDVRRKAQEGLRVSQAAMQGKQQMPAEFGRYVENALRSPAWMEF